MATPNPVPIEARHVLWRALWDRLLTAPAVEPDARVSGTAAPHPDLNDDEPAPEPTAEESD